MKLNYIKVLTLSLFLLPDFTIASSGLSDDILYEYENKRTGFHDVDKYLAQPENERSTFLRKELKENEDFLRALKKLSEEKNTPVSNGIYYSMMADLTLEKQNIFFKLKELHKNLKSFEKGELEASPLLAKGYFQEALDIFESVIDVNDSIKLKKFYDSSEGAALFYYGFVLKNMDILTNKKETSYLKKMCSLVPILIEKPERIAQLPSLEAGYSPYKANMFSALGYGNRLLAINEFQISLNKSFLSNPTLVLQSIEQELQRRLND